MFADTSHFRSLYYNQRSNEVAIENANRKKLNYPSSYYAEKFIENYENYYKNGGQKRNKFNDDVYKRLTGNDPLPANPNLKKPSGKRNNPSGKRNNKSNNKLLTKKQKKNYKLNKNSPKLLTLFNNQKNENTSNKMTTLNNEISSKKQKKSYKLNKNSHKFSLLPNIFKKNNKYNLVKNNEKLYPKKDKVLFLNTLTNQFELAFDKETYLNLSNEEKNIIKRYFRFSPKKKRWVSKARSGKLPRWVWQDLKLREDYAYYKLYDGYTQEQLKEIEKNKILRKITSYEKIIKSKQEKAEALKADWLKYSSDISFLTQPIIKGHKGSEAFGRRRERMFNNYRKALEEENKIEYYKNKINELNDELKTLDVS